MSDDKLPVFDEKNPLPESPKKEDHIGKAESEDVKNG